MLLDGVAFVFRVSEFDVVVVVVVVVRGPGGSQEGDPPPAWSVFGLTGSIQGLRAAPEPGRTGLPEGPEHLPAGAGRHTPTGRTAGRHWEHWDRCREPFIMVSPVRPWC